MSTILGGDGPDFIKPRRLLRPPDVGPTRSTRLRGGFGGVVDTSRCRLDMVMRAMSQAVIVVAERGSDDEHEAAERDATRAADDESAATGGADVVVVARALPWEEPNGRRSDWYALRKTNRTPMVPFCSARSPRCETERVVIRASHMETTR